MAVETPAERHFDQAITLAREAFVAAIERGDATAAGAMYEADARLILPDTAPIDGRHAIEGFWQVGLEAGVSAVDLEPRNVLHESTFACEIGSYRLQVAPEHEARVDEHGAYLIVHRRGEDGAWRRAFELFSPEPADTRRVRF